MRLVSANGAAVELRPVGYQFPAITTAGDWDANWLVIEASARLHTGESWSFSDPCLTTWEAEAVLGWLRQVVGGIVEPSAGPSDDEAALLDFTEPGLAFSLSVRGRGRIGLHVHFGLGALPPWATEEFDEFAMLLDMSESELRGSIGEWATELAAFPAR